MVGGVLLAGDQLLGVVQLAVGAGGVAHGEGAVLLRHVVPHLALVLVEARRTAEHPQPEALQYPDFRLQEVAILTISYHCLLVQPVRARLLM